MSAVSLQVPMDAYVRDAFGDDRPPSLNASVAHLILTRSAQHAWVAHPRLNAGWLPDQDSRFDLGTAAHAILLEGKRGLICAIDAEDWRSKAAKTQRELARLDGKIPLLAHQAEAVMRMVDTAKAALERCRDLRHLGELVAEQTILWHERELADVDVVWCRCRPDWTTLDGRVAISYKTTNAVGEPDTFSRRALVDLGYDLQAAFESRAIELLHGSAPKYVWLVQECEPPYAVSFLGMTPELHAFAMAKYRRARAIWTECLARNEFPGYPDRICWVDPPAWSITQWEEREATRVYVASASQAVDDGRPLGEQLLG